MNSLNRDMFKPFRSHNGLLGTKNQPEVFQTEVFSWTSARYGHAKCLFFQDLEGLTEVFGGISAGTSGRRLPLWADFSFLITVCSVEFLVMCLRICTVFKGVSFRETRL